jgi:hypothetical protein
LRAGDHVIVSQDVALLVQDRAGAGAFLRFDESKKSRAYEVEWMNTTPGLKRAVDFDVVLFVRDC